ncbi:MAG: hypothetical protein JKX84_01460 [Flavobacteriales bacterium]|nr:hypothetical protein [Flavobacteriales bacterium]
MDNIHLRIADFNIELVNRSEFPVALEEGYADFIVPFFQANADVTVVVENGIPEEKKKLENPIYSANYNGEELWKIARTDNGLRFHVFNPDPPYALQQVAELNSDYSVWTVYSEPRIEKDSTRLLPLLYPLGPLVMYYLTVKYDAVMLHGSGISDNGMGRIFSGVSGKGKTTMSKLWFHAGAEVLNDDRLIIRKTKSGYEVYNTPMFYQDHPRKAPLSGIYLIYHSPENTLEKLGGATAVSLLGANLIQHGYDEKIIEHHLNFLTEMVSSVPVCSLGFVPDGSVVKMIRAL